MRTINIDLLLRETVSPTHADVYSLQERLNESFSHDYHVAYAYGPEGEAKRVHQKVAAGGAEQLEIPLADYLRLWDEAVEAITQFHDVPEEFQDERYIVEREDTPLEKAVNARR